MRKFRCRGRACRVAGGGTKYEPPASAHFKPREMCPYLVSSPRARPDLPALLGLLRLLCFGFLLPAALFDRLARVRGKPGRRQNLRREDLDRRLLDDVALIVPVEITRLVGDGTGLVG